MVSYKFHTTFSIYFIVLIIPQIVLLMNFKNVIVQSFIRFSLKSIHYNHPYSSINTISGSSSIILTNKRNYSRRREYASSFYDRIILHGKKLFGEETDPGDVKGTKYKVLKYPHPKVKLNIYYNII